MKVSEIKGLNLSELDEKLSSLKQEHFNLRFQHSAGQLENTASLKRVKLDIARVKTVMREKL